MTKQLCDAGGEAVLAGDDVHHHFIHRLRLQLWQHGQWLTSDRFHTVSALIYLQSLYWISSTGPWLAFCMLSHLRDAAPTCHQAPAPTISWRLCGLHVVNPQGPVCSSILLQHALPNDGATIQSILYALLGGIWSWSCYRKSHTHGRHWPPCQGAFPYCAWLVHRQYKVHRTMISGPVTFPCCRQCFCSPSHMGIGILPPAGSSCKNRTIWATVSTCERPPPGASSAHRSWCWWVRLPGSWWAGSSICQQYRHWPRPWQPWHPQTGLSEAPSQTSGIVVEGHHAVKSIRNS